MCYVKCQNILVHLLEHLSYGLKCLSSLLSKFASQLKLIQSVVRVGILGSVTSSVLQVLLSGLWVSGSQVPSPKFQGPSSRVPESQGSEFQGRGSQGLRVPGPRFQGPGSWVSGPDIRLCPSNFLSEKFTFPTSFGNVCFSPWFFIIVNVWHSFTYLFLYWRTSITNIK